MKILQAHNRYQGKGGEDTVCEAEKSILRDHGNDVIEYTRNNDEIKGYTLINKLALYWATTWSNRSYREVRDLCRKCRPDVAHFHNTLPLISPAAYYACRDSGVPIVQTLHNYRLLCPGAMLMRNGKVCEDCISSAGLWPSLKHKCYRNSLIQTATARRMLLKHRKMGTYAGVVNRYIALAGFSKRKFVEGGLPAEKIVVKPNFVPEVGRKGRSNGDCVLFVGRISVEKGLKPLLTAFAKLPELKLRIVGDGPERATLESDFASCGNVNFLGNCERPRVTEEMKACGFLAFPSLWYETFGMTVVESFACGKPVVVSRIGVPKDIVEDGVTGLHFEPGNPDELAEKVNWMIGHPDECRRMGENARRVYEEKYTPDQNYEMLMDIYNQTIEEYKSNNETNAAL